MRGEPRPRLVVLWCWIFTRHTGMMRSSIFVLSLFCIVFATVIAVPQEEVIALAEAHLRSEFPYRENFLVATIEIETEDDEAVAYLIDYQDGGFVVFSTKLMKVIAYSNSNYLFGANRDTHTRGAEFVKDVVHGIQSVPTEGRKILDAEIEVNPVLPFMTTKWAQGGGNYPRNTYNNMSPLIGPRTKGDAGCVPVAVSQILKYWNYPKRGVSSKTICAAATFFDQCPEDMVLTADFGATKYDWPNMPDYLHAYSRTTQIDAISELMLHVAIAGNGKFTERGTGVSMAYALYSLRKHFAMTDITQVKRADYSAEEFFNMINNEIQLHRPVLLSGYDASVEAGHSYVVHGIDRHGMVYINQGWEGNADGYYDLENIVVVVSRTLSFTERLAAYIKMTPHIRALGQSCNGVTGSRCADGLECRSLNETGLLIDEFTSDEIGQCELRKPDEEEFQLISSSFSFTTERDQWIDLGPFHSVYGFEAVMYGDGDADLYVREGSQPTSESYDCRPYKAGSAETCKSGGANDFYVSIGAYRESTNLTLEIHYYVEHGTVDKCANVTCETRECHVTNCVEGVCVDTESLDGTLCDDHNNQTLNDICIAGVCSGIIDRCANVVCEAPESQCHESHCVNGTCVLAELVNGSMCDDGNQDTLNDICTAGICAGTLDKCINVTCTAQDQCHLVGECIEGVCTNPTVTDGMSCDDGNSNSTHDKCFAGVCSGIIPECDESCYDLVSVSFNYTTYRNQWIYLEPFASKYGINLSMEGDGDADMYVKAGAQPGVGVYDCRPYKSGSFEECSLEGDDVFYVAINGYKPSTSLKLYIEYFVSK